MTLLPGFDLITASTLSAYGLSDSLLFTQDPLNTMPQHLNEWYLQQNLPYLAPEVALNGEPALGGDIYSLGYMMYQLVAGRAQGENERGGVEPETDDAGRRDVLTDVHRHVIRKFNHPIDVMKGVVNDTNKIPSRQLGDIYYDA